MSNRQQLIKRAKAKWTLEQRQRQNPLSFLKPINHPKLNQLAFVESDKKNKCAFGGNRSGKTKIGGAYYLVNKLVTTPNFQARASTWSDMSIPIQQKAVYEMLPKNIGIKYNYNEKTGFYRRIIEFPNGSLLRFKTYEQGWQTFQGAGLDIEWDDEEPPEEIVKEQKMRIADRNGELIRTMTPLNGITYTYDEVIENEGGNKEIAYWFWDNRFNPYVHQSSLQNTVNSYGEKEAIVRGQGLFRELTSGTAYYSFSEDNIIAEYNEETRQTEDGKYKYVDYRPIEVDCDFNVALMCWNVSQTINEIDYTYDYVEMENHANTAVMCQTLLNKYPDHKAGFIFYGDIAGSKRDPAASRTNWAIIREYFPDAEIYYQSIKNIKDRVDATNGRLKNAKGEVHCYIAKNCKRLIKDCRQVTWEHLLSKGKAGKLTHASDGKSYKLFWKYPLTPKTRVTVR